MKIDEYQSLTSTTAIYPKEKALEYLLLGLGSEVGEIQGKIKKVIRDNTPIDIQDLGKEIGDVMWYISELCNHLGLSLENILIHNIDKLSSRAARGVLGGSGDNR